MKHNYKIVLIVVLLFILTQLVGMAINYIYLNKDLPYDIQKPEFKQETSFISIFIFIIIATLFAFLLLHFRAERLWKIWFFLSIWLALVIGFGAFINQQLALLLAFIFAILKLFRQSIILHNFTELFLYGGLAAIFVPSFSVLSISILLVLISIYDMIAVWKTKHMIKLAKFQSKAGVFAGLIIPYKYRKKTRTAILGGGDVGFPILFSSVIMKSFGLISLLIPFTTAIALFFLFYKGEKNKFYPAMPFLSIGCFFGLLLVFLISKYF